MCKIFALVLMLSKICYTKSISYTTCVELTDSNATGTVLWPNSSSYSLDAMKYWDLRSNLSPACIVIPENASQASTIVAILSKNRAQFAIRGSNNINDGVLIALNELKTLQISTDRQTIEVGPGNQWVDIYNELDKYGLYAIGGRLKTIGVSGLSLFGGFNYFNNKYGWAMDNVVSYEVILANGTQVTANSSSHQDLFWALKGGANNFGLVTLFTLRTYAIPNVSTTIQTFNESEIPALLNAICAFTQANHPSVAAGTVITIMMNMTTNTATFSIMGVQEGIESPPSRFANFSDIPAVRRLDNVTTPAQWHSTLDTRNQVMRYQWAHHTMKPDAEQLISLYRMWRDAVMTVADVQGLFPSFVLNPMPKSANSVAKTNGIGNVWGLDDDQSWVLFQTSTGWTQAEDDLRMTAWAKSLIEGMHDMNREADLSSDFLYMGDISEFQDPFAGFPEENVNRMKDIRDVYDADGAFRKLNWGGFKLSA